MEKYAEEARLRKYEIRAELESQVLALRKRRSKKLRESGNIVSNIIENFPVRVC